MSIRQELAKLEHMPPWGRAQGDNWDRLSNFIYQTYTLQGVQSQAQTRARAAGLPVEAFEAYAIRRWFNHHTHDQILKLFYAHLEIQPEPNRRHRTIDFYLRGLPFDLKLSLFPRAYPQPLLYAQQHPHHLAQWQYDYQSRQGRYHTDNRFFIILHNQAQPELSWQLRRDFATLDRLIANFLQAPTLLGLTITHQHTGEIHRPWAAVIFHIS